MKRSRRPIQRKSELKRGKRLRSKPKEPMSQREKDAAGAWFRSVMETAKVRIEGRPLPVDAVDGKPGSADDPLEAHHVIEKEDLKKLAKSRGLDIVQLLWDPRNGMAVRRSRHVRHTNRFDPLPVSAVPESAWEFAREHGIEWRIEQDYAA